MTLEERVELLEKRIAELDTRTIGMIRLGPVPGDEIKELHDAVQAAMESLKEVLPVDRNARCLADGSPETADHQEIDPVAAALLLRKEAQ